MVGRSLPGAAAALVLAAMLSGCASTPSNSRAAAMITAELPAGQVERTEHFALGRFTLAMIRPLVRMAGDLEDQEAELIKSLRRVEISTFTIDPPLDDPTQLRFERIGQALAADGWSPFIREHDAHDSTLLLVREDAKGRISGLYVLTGDATELEVIRVEGKLDRIIAEAIADNPEILGGLADS